MVLENWRGARPDRYVKGTCGTCPECEEKYTLRSDGKLRHHLRENAKGDMVGCPGSSGRPIEHEVKW